MRLEIKKAGINGEGIAFYKRKPVFIDGCFPDEIVECKLFDEGRHYRGELIKIIKKSKSRVKSPCVHQRRCGGCALMNVNYAEQLRIKKQLLEGALLKYTNTNFDVGEIEGSDDTLFYRNKCNLPVIEKDGKLISALYSPGTNHPVYIDNCLVHDIKIEEIRNKVLSILNKHHLRAYDHHLKKGVRQLVIRGFDANYQLTIITGNDDLSNVLNDLENIDNLVSIYQGINTHKNPVQMMPEKIRLLSGKDKINIKVGDFKLKLSPQAFFQLNLKQAEKIYSKVNELIDDNCTNIIEAYCGIGAMSLYVSNKAKEVIGIEIIDKAVKDAKENAKINHIDNVSFICDDAPKAIRRIVKNKKIDTLIVDPPRTGLDDELLITLLKTNIKSIIYISCNPATLAKNLDVLMDKYEIKYIKGYDMFPNTPHVETVCCLYHQKKDFISVPYEPKNAKYLKQG